MIFSSAVVPGFLPLPSQLSVPVLDESKSLSMFDDIFQYFQTGVKAEKASAAPLPRLQLELHPSIITALPTI